MEKRTLCKECAQNYREAGYVLRSEGFQYIRQPCDICMRGGFEYTVLDKSGGDRNECS